MIWKSGRIPIQAWARIPIRDPGHLPKGLHCQGMPQAIIWQGKTLTQSLYRQDTIWTQDRDPLQGISQRTTIKTARSLKISLGMELMLTKMTGCSV